MCMYIHTQIYLAEILGPGISHNISWMTLFPQVGLFCEASVVFYKNETV